MGIVKYNSLYCGDCMGKKIFFTFFAGTFIFLFMIITLISVMDNGVYDNEEESNDNDDESEYITTGISDEIMRYEKYFKKYTKEYNIEGYLDVVMALAMQESGGRHLDVMQSSESLGLEPNSITSPEKSIKVGVEYFSNVMKKADNDVKLALQAYNFGVGFIEYANEHGGYSKEVATDFSLKMASEQGFSSYGDVEYVDHVMRYLEEDKVVKNDSDGDWGYPLKEVTVNSEFGNRMHPIHNTEKLHSGIDFACSIGDNVMSVKIGEVVEVNKGNTGYGNYVTIRHEKDEYSRYAHLSKVDVSIGDELKSGVVIGECGNTGDSTGAHLHLEHMKDLSNEDSSYENPRKILGLEKD